MREILARHASILKNQRPISAIKIRPVKGWAGLNLADLWHYRELLWILALRDVKLRYKQTVLGIIWVILQPLLAALIFAVIFGRLAKLPTDGLPYILFAYAGLVGWNYFSGAVERAGSSLITQTNLITKIYFPRMLIPLSSMVSVLVDLVVTLVVMLGMLLAFGLLPSWQVFALPLFLLLIALTAAGVGLWLSALGVYYRDFVYAIPFLIQIWLYASPVVYSTSIVPENLRWLYALNPMVSGIEGVRWSVLGRGILNEQMMVTSTLVALLIFLSGLFLFKRVESNFADVI